MEHVIYNCGTTEILGQLQLWIGSWIQGIWKATTTMLSSTKRILNQSLSRKRKTSALKKIQHIGEEKKGIKPQNMKAYIRSHPHCGGLACESQTA